MDKNSLSESYLCAGCKQLISPPEAGYINLLMELSFHIDPEINSRLKESGHDIGDIMVASASSGKCEEKYQLEHLEFTKRLAGIREPRWRVNPASLEYLPVHHLKSEIEKQKEREYNKVMELIKIIQNSYKKAS